MITVHKYEDINVDFNLFLNCCKLGNCVISLARPFHVCIPLTVIDSRVWVVFGFLTQLVHDLLNSGCLLYKA